MVKKIDEIAPIDHVGWDLWSASRAWKERFARDMVAAGYPWFEEARAGVLGHLDRAGTRQAELVTRMGISKQAVQQLVDELVADGILARVADPGDRRGRIVRLTAAGLAVISEADAVKRRIEKDCAAELGPSGLRQLKHALRRLEQKLR